MALATTQLEYGRQMFLYEHNSQLTASQLRNPAVPPQAKFDALATTVESGSRILATGAQIVCTTGKEVESLRSDCARLRGRFNDMRKKSSAQESQQRLVELESKRTSLIVKMSAAAVGGVITFALVFTLIKAADKYAEFDKELQEVNYEIDFIKKFPEATNDKELKEMYLSALRNIAYRNYASYQASLLQGSVSYCNDDGEICYLEGHSSDPTSIQDKADFNVEVAKSTLEKVEQEIREAILIRYYE